MHLLHTGFGIGSFIVPLIANPFLAVVQRSVHNGTNDSLTISTCLTKDYNHYINDTLASGTTTSSVGTTEIIFLEESRIEYAYAIVAVITICVSMSFFLYQCRGAMDVNTSGMQEEAKEEEPRTLKQVINPATCAGGNLGYGITILTLLFINFFNAVGGERVYGKFIRAFSIDYLCFSKDEGSYINTAFWISFAVGRFSGFVAARWIPIRILITVEAVGILVTATILNTVGYKNKLLLWIFTQPMGFFIAPLFPSGIAWGDHHIEMTGLGITILLLGGAVGGIAYLNIIGHFYTVNGPRSVMYVMQAYGVAVVAFVLVLNFIGYRHGDRYEKQSQELDVAEAKTDKQNISDVNNTTHI